MGKHGRCDYSTAGCGPRDNLEGSRYARLKQEGGRHWGKEPEKERWKEADSRFTIRAWRCALTPLLVNPFNWQMADSCLLSNVVLLISLTRALASARGTSCIVLSHRLYQSCAQGQDVQRGFSRPVAPQSRTRVNPTRSWPPHKPRSQGKPGTTRVSRGDVRFECVLMSGRTFRSAQPCQLTRPRTCWFSGGKGDGSLGRQGGLSSRGEGWSVSALASLAPKREGFWA